MPESPPQYILDAIGQLIAYGVVKGFPQDEGWNTTIDNVSIGLVPLGDYQVSVVRTKKPSE